MNVFYFEQRDNRESACCCGEKMDEGKCAGGEANPKWQNARRVMWTVVWVYKSYQRAKKRDFQTVMR